MSTTTPHRRARSRQLLTWALAIALAAGSLVVAGWTVAALVTYGAEPTRGRLFDEAPGSLPLDEWFSEGSHDKVPGLIAARVGDQLWTSTPYGLARFDLAARTLRRGWPLPREPYDLRPWDTIKARVHALAPRPDGGLALAYGVTGTEPGGDRDAPFDRLAVAIATPDGWAREPELLDLPPETRVLDARWADDALVMDVAMPGGRQQRLRIPAGPSVIERHPATSAPDADPAPDAPEPPSPWQPYPNGSFVVAAGDPGRFTAQPRAYVRHLDAGVRQEAIIPQGTSRRRSFYHGAQWVSGRWIATHADLGDGHLHVYLVADHEPAARAEDRVAGQLGLKLDEAFSSLFPRYLQIGPDPADPAGLIAVDVFTSSYVRLDADLRRADPVGALELVPLWQLLALLAGGLVLVLGALAWGRASGKPSPLRFALVLGCTLHLLFAWAVMPDVLFALRTSPPVFG